MPNTISHTRYLVFRTLALNLSQKDSMDITGIGWGATSRHAAALVRDGHLVRLPGRPPRYLLGPVPIPPIEETTRVTDPSKSLATLGLRRLGPLEVHKVVYQVGVRQPPRMSLGRYPGWVKVGDGPPRYVARDVEVPLGGYGKAVVGSLYYLGGRDRKTLELSMPSEEIREVERADTYLDWASAVAAEAALAFEGMTGARLDHDRDLVLKGEPHGAVVLPADLWASLKVFEGTGLLPGDVWLDRSHGKYHLEATFDRMLALWKGGGRQP